MRREEKRRGEEGKGGYEKRLQSIGQSRPRSSPSSSCGPSVRVDAKQTKGKEDEAEETTTASSCSLHPSHSNTLPLHLVSRICVVVPCDGDGRRPKQRSGSPSFHDCTARDSQPPSHSLPPFPGPANATRGTHKHASNPHRRPARAPRRAASVREKRQLVALDEPALHPVLGDHNRADHTARRPVARHSVRDRCKPRRSTRTRTTTTTVAQTQCPSHLPRSHRPLALQLFTSRSLGHSVTRSLGHSAGRATHRGGRSRGTRPWTSPP